MKNFTFLLVSVFMFFSALSQKEADKWYFGTMAGLDFSSGTPTVIPGSAMSPPEGSAVMSDANGNLLLYCDGVSVWNKNHTVMPNGDSLNGGTSSTQAALIVPSPTNTSLYYIFTTDEFGGGNGLQYSTVDMTLDGGNGDVVTKNIPLQTPVAEKLTGVKDPGANRYWVLAHGWGNDTFYAYPVTGSGVGTPVTTNIGTVHSGTPQNTYGQMKFSPCGDKIGLTIGYYNAFELFHFNTTTGVVSNSLQIPMQEHVYGFEFSQDASRIYVSSYYSNTFQFTLSQFDITNWSFFPVITSQYTLTASDIYGLQLGNDGKIYCCRPFNQYLGVINAPNQLGASCNYVDMGLDLDPSFMGTTSSLSLPGFLTSYLQSLSGTCQIPTDIPEPDNDKDFALYPNPSSDNFKMNFEREGVLEVYSATGALMEKFDVKQGSSFVLGQNYAPGIYFAKLVSDRNSHSTKLIKE